MIQKIRFFIIRLLAGKTILVANIITDTIYISGGKPAFIWDCTFIPTRWLKRWWRSKEHSIRGGVK